MYAIVKDGSITATGTLKQLFPTTSFAGGVANSEFKKAENLEDVEKDLKARNEDPDEQLGKQIYSGAFMNKKVDTEK